MIVPALILAGLVLALAGPPLLAALSAGGFETAATTPAATPSPAVAATAPATPTAAPTPLPPTSTPAPTPSPAPSPTLSPSPAPTVKPTAKPTAAPTAGSGITYYRGFADPRTIEPEAVSDPLSLRALVNKFYALPADFVPPLVTADGTDEKVQPAANEAWIELQAACLKATGVKLELLAGYRSYAEQKALFVDAIRRKGITWTVPYNALEGRSEHQLGLALDFNDGVCKDFSLAFAKSKAGIWLDGQAWQYGFILRYPSGKEKITDYAYEPWHYRFVGREAAARCHEHNWTLEEYCRN